MNRKTIAIVLEAIPVISAAVSFVLIKIPADTEITRIMILITVFLAFFGFAYFWFAEELLQLRVLKNWI